MATKTVERVSKKLYSGCTPAERQRIDQKLGEIAGALAEFDVVLAGLERGPDKDRVEAIRAVVEHAEAMYFSCSGCHRPPALGCKCTGPDGQPLDWN